MMRAGTLDRMAARAGAGSLVVFTVLFFIALIAPIVVVVLVSFSPDESLAVPLGGLSLRWYHRLWEYRPFVDSLLTSLYLALSSSFIAILIAVPAAIGVGRSSGRVATALTTFLLAPIAIPALVIGLSLLYFLSNIGIGVSFLALLIAHTVVSVPYVMRTTLATYKNTHASYLEAASVLGADRWQTFRHVTLPLIAPGIFAGALFSILVSLDNLGVSYFFGTANVTTLPVVMLSYLQNQFDPAIAAISTVQMAITIVLLLIVEKTYGLRALTTQ
ncbi:MULTISPECIES: ABC transporter permease [unclassified Caballeronia]|uniref:ABC transporter permease n=1 Tax=unclassified Caballeronia TaxID=2646786 RepID=UPI00285C6116|nr:MULTISPECIES: ABC transporter permease [unclassified Caballeronia]MDR5818786.1 ABC transporter permease [Caballeronia sp. LZ033]MDR5825865.1 ABC transporter permease [Caballeronia sp. LZ043]MDR5884219.1 ABC transporter permease [Caballeronia sp. LZ032]